MRATDADVIHLSEEHLLRRLISKGIQTNVLVTCREFGIERIVEFLARQLAPPVSVGVVSGGLTMPQRTTGVWLVHDVAVLSAAQQRDLLEWIATAGAHVQIVSIASEPLWPLVASGRFAERLYYQLNTIVCEAMRAGGRSIYDERPAAS